MPGHSQNHLAVAGGCAALVSERVYDVPTRYREVVLTVSKHDVQTPGLTRIAAQRADQLSWLCVRGRSRRSVPQESAMPRGHHTSRYPLVQPRTINSATIALMHMPRLVRSQLQRSSTSFPA